jgi:hypothetical protein
MRFIGFFILRNSNGPAISPPNEFAGIPRNDPLPIKAAARKYPLFSLNQGAVKMTLEEDIQKTKAFVFGDLYGA